MKYSQSTAAHPVLFHQRARLQILLLLQIVVGLLQHIDVARMLIIHFFDLSTRTQA